MKDERLLVDCACCSPRQRKIYLAAESAGVGSVLGDFHLFDLLAERSTVTGTVPRGEQAWSESCWREVSKLWSQNVLAGDSHLGSSASVSNKHRIQTLRRLHTFFVLLAMAEDGREVNLMSQTLQNSNKSWVVRT